MDGIETVTNDQCMFGLVTKGENGKLMPAKKPTRWMTNSIFMVEALNVKCDKQHKHQHLVGGRAAAAAFYPPNLLRAILKGMARTRDCTRGVRMICENERNILESLNTSVASLSRKSDPNKTTAHDNSAGSDPRPNEHTTTTTDDNEVRTSSSPLKGGGVLPVKYHSHNFKTIYKD